MKITDKQTGFTLLELMFTIAVLAIIIAIAIPSFRLLTMNNRITTNTNEFASALSLARIEAIKRGAGAVIKANSGGGTGNEWGVGFVVSVWNDADSDDVVDSSEIGDTLRQVEAFNGDVALDSASGITEISFLSSGAYNSSSSAVFTICDDSRTGEKGRQFTLNVTGTFNLDRDYTCP